jgi:hypothetical protein
MLCFSRKKDDKLEEEESPVFDTSKIYFDEQGNLRYDPHIHSFDRKFELQSILELDPGDEKVMFEILIYFPLIFLLFLSYLI